MKITRVLEMRGYVLAYDADELPRDDEGGIVGAEVHCRSDAVAFHEEDKTYASRLLTGVSRLELEICFPPGAAGAVWVEADADDARIVAELDAARARNSGYFEEINRRLGGVVGDPVRAPV